MTPKQNAEAIEAALKAVSGYIGFEYKYNALRAAMVALMAANKAASEENK
ncbi:hypothetical protein [Vibrio phage vB_ValP_IME234]|nr:hypothetical protein [Vibrio phage vB_ValP_IME234]